MPGEDIEFLQQKIRELEEENKQLKNSSSGYDTHDLEEQCKLIKSVPFIFIIIGNNKQMILQTNYLNYQFRLQVILCLVFR